MSDLSHIDTSNAVWVEYPPPYEWARLPHAALGEGDVKWLVKPADVPCEARTTVAYNGALYVGGVRHGTVPSGHEATPVVVRDGVWALLCETEQ